MLCGSLILMEGIRQDVNQHFQGLKIHVTVLKEGGFHAGYLGCPKTHPQKIPLIAMELMSNMVPLGGEDAWRHLERQHARTHEGFECLKTVTPRFIGYVKHC